ncbi:cuticle protein-like [Homarus americanus]|uniref:cuticle protein-like n=1 Tax=Homarus americanus TaxID=6706 RepID=UPI001C44840C|nr:cuticle protein-like [Homarus americanus]
MPVTEVRDNTKSLEKPVLHGCVRPGINRGTNLVMGISCQHYCTMNTKVLLLLAMVAVAAADERPLYYEAPHDSHEDHGSDEYEPAKYDFEWSVKDEEYGNDFGHKESRDGDHTQGSYYVQLPDSRHQTVTYYVDGDSGYVAEVTYEGEAHYPDSYEYKGYSHES